jgi:hypothetical protein
MHGWIANNRQNNIYQFRSSIKEQCQSIRVKNLEAPIHPQDSGTTL